MMDVKTFAIVLAVIANNPINAILYPKQSETLRTLAKELLLYQNNIDAQAVIAAITTELEDQESPYYPLTRITTNDYNLLLTLKDTLFPQAYTPIPDSGELFNQVATMAVTPKIVKVK